MRINKAEGPRTAIKENRSTGLEEKPLCRTRSTHVLDAIFDRIVFGSHNVADTSIASVIVLKAIEYIRG
jgi:hypothetical protein